MAGLVTPIMRRIHRRPGSSTQWYNAMDRITASTSSPMTIHPPPGSSSESSNCLVAHVHETCTSS
ncbi:Uncharacterised protein [Mycobacteroides abscessus subsp. abscessus]|nr:Uncharacterised protein [Mycobacteroides abscessus subsp. abscessus]